MWSHTFSLCSLHVLYILYRNEISVSNSNTRYIILLTYRILFLKTLILSCLFSIASLLGLTVTESPTTNSYIFLKRSFSHGMVKNYFTLFFSRPKPLEKVNVDKTCSYTYLSTQLQDPKETCVEKESECKK